MKLNDIFLLDPSVVFLNHGSFGATPRRVLQQQRALQERMERNPMAFFVRELEGLLDHTREYVAPFVGASVEDIVFVPNATFAVNAVLRSIVLEPGDNILVTDHGYNACNNVARFVAESQGAFVRVAHIPFDADADEIHDRIVSRADARTRLAMIDHVTSPTALVLPVERVVRSLRERGIATLVDGAHAVGMLPLQLESLGAGYYTSNFHKWVCAPKGAAMLWVRRDLQSRVRPSVLSHGANTSRRDRSRYRIEFDWTGTIDPSAVLSVPTAIEVMRELVPGGWETLRAQNHALALAARSLLAEIPGVKLVGDASMLGSMAACVLPPSLAIVEDSTVDVLGGALQRWLAVEHKIEVPVFPWRLRDRQGVEQTLQILRVSAQVYNHREQYELLCSVLRERITTRDA